MNKKLICNKKINQQYDKQMEQSKILMQNILQKEFSPPILITKKLKGKICKLSSISILRYLRSKQ